MLVSVVVPEKMPGQKGDKENEEKKNMNFGHFLRLFKITLSN